ncbi:MAG: hypothetical protein EXR93_08980 [Gemmatimonadetes bacterium]|nr:hypothetical protein [Gemmatimonadota bacterium]
MGELADRLRAALGDAYRLDRELGGGGMSRLFLATEASLDRRVVIKLLPPEFTSDVSAARFEQEIRLAAHLQHPHILPVLTAGAKDGLLYYVMPYVPGESLRHLAALTGDTTGAVKAYSHYLALRYDPEPSIKPEVDRIRAELARLVAERN